eukprot:5989737-Amphidinium_carterae.1
MLFLHGQNLLPPVPTPDAVQMFPLERVHSGAKHVEGHSPEPQRAHLFCSCSTLLSDPQSGQFHRLEVLTARRFAFHSLLLQTCRRENKCQSRLLNSCRSVVPSFISILAGGALPYSQDVSQCEPGNASPEVLANPIKRCSPGSCAICSS